MKLFYVFLFFITAKVASTGSSYTHLQVNGQLYGVPNFAAFEELPEKHNGDNGDNNSPIGKTNDEKNDEKPAASKKLDFEKPIYIINEEKQKIQKGYKIPFSIAVTQEITKKGNFKISDAQKSDMASHFQASHDKGKIMIEVMDDIPEDNWKKINLLILLLEFLPEDPNDDPIHTSLIIFCQDKKTDPPTKINFDETNYKINIYPEYIGIVEQFVAKLDKDDGKTPIKYSLLFENDKDDILKNSLKINELTGILEKTKAMQPGARGFKISAKIDDKIHTEVDATLIVKHAIVCDSDKSKFLYAQIVKHFPQDKTGDILEPMAKPDEKCVYKIASQEPKGDYFQLDEKTAGLKLQKEIKPDANIFKDPKNPKFVIKLSATCQVQLAGDDETKKDANQPTTADNNLDILYNPNEMTLILYIDKPNPPVFSTENIVIGYPKEYDIIMNYDIPFVTSVLTHTNEPTNAIQYSIVEENCPFAVHPSKGDIYPLSFYNGDKDYTFTILAKDESRKTEGKLSVTIKFLTESELVEAVFIDTALDFDKLLQDCSAKADIKIKPLTQAIVPITDEVKKSNKIPNDKKQTRLMKTLCYAFDSKDQNFVKGEMIVDKLKSSSDIFVAEIVTRKIPDSHPQEGGTSSFALTSAIIAVILALAVITTVMYLIFIRRSAPVVIMRRNNARNSVTPLEDDMEAPSQTRWINSHIDVYNRYDQMEANAFPNPSYDTRRVSYSNTNGEIVIMENRMQTTSNDLLSSGVSSFKPDMSNEDPSSDINGVYYDLEFPTATGASTSAPNNVPVLDVTSLPPISGDRRRKKTNGDS